MTPDLLYIRAISPLHAGTGVGLGGIDLPIAREKATGVPYLPGSGLKGPLRDLVTDVPTREAIFGPDINNADAHAGALQVGDARLLLLPVRSLAGTFALVTSPHLLSRYLEDARAANLPNLPSDPSNPSKPETCYAGSAIDTGNKVILEDLDLIPTADTKDTTLSLWTTHLSSIDSPGLASRLCIVHDDVMSFLLETATEVVARIKLQPDTKTVQRGGLWYEENLPAESVLVSLLLASDSRKVNKHLDATKVLEETAKAAKGLVQLGGKATVGRGLCRLKFAKTQVANGEEVTS